MQIFILFCIIVGAFAKECPENSHYNNCGTACPLTCENYQNPPKACVLMCNPGCHCDEGYVKTKDGQCVKPEQCPSSSDDCPANSHYEECASACPVTCDNYKNPPKICVLMCKSGCHCDKGYVEAKDGRCVEPKECSSGDFEVNSCLEKPDTGLCRGSFDMFYYDARNGVCKEFIYGGCGGNGNKFGTEEECLEKCSDVRVWESGSGNPICNLPLETGPCFASKHQYGFDKVTGQCKKFIYGGCQGNENNFDTLEDCQKACPEAKCGENKEYHECGTACPLTCDNYQDPPKVCPAMCVIGCHCKEGYVKTKDNRCVLPENCPASALDRPDCDKGYETGPCRANIPRFYYDQEAGMCKKFVYGGCGGNRNNFRTEDECYNKCGALAAPVSCQMDKEVGPCRGAFPRYFFNKESNQCERFTFGGCLGNSNNFDTKEDCEAVCLGNI